MSKFSPLAKTLPALLILLVGCATSTGYGPAGATANAFGFSDQKIEEGRFRITYRGRDIIEAGDGVLRRAAELTKAAGYDHFTVVYRDNETEARRSQRPSIGIGGSTGGRRSGVGVGVSLPLGGQAPQAVTSRIEIIMGRGDKPDGPDSYNASDVLGNLGTIR
ncbi:MAG: hypothetical protein AAF986_04935 [Pseudomonadota bacterium]